jgi:hypothetical protein
MAIARSEAAATVGLEEWPSVVGYQESKTVKKLIEHIFLSELLQECWFRRRQIIEVLRAEVDAAGYDLVLEAGGTIRHVQLKASRNGARTARQTINSMLGDRSPLPALRAFAGQPLPGPCAGGP